MRARRMRACADVQVQTLFMRARARVCVCVCACGCGYARGYLDAEGVGSALRQYAGALALALLLLRDRSLVGSAKSRSAAQPGEPKEALKRFIAFLFPCDRVHKEFTKREFTKSRLRTQPVWPRPPRGSKRAAATARSQTKTLTKGSSQRP